MPCTPRGTGFISEFYAAAAISQKPVSIWVDCCQTKWTWRNYWSTCLCSVNKDDNQFLNSVRRLVYGVFLNECFIHCQHSKWPMKMDWNTAAFFHGSSVIICDVIVDPWQIWIRLHCFVVCLLALQPSRNHSVTQQAWEKTDLQCKPVFRLPNVQDITCICRACLCIVNKGNADLAEIRALAFFVHLHVFLRQAELRALADVQFDLLLNVSHDLCGLWLFSSIHKVGYQSYLHLQCHPAFSFYNLRAHLP